MNFKSSLAPITLAVLMFGATVAASAATVIIDFSQGTRFNTEAISNAAVNGADMTGMQVEACNVDNVCRSATWAASLGEADSGGVVGDGWSITQTGDTFSSSFTVSLTDFAASRLTFNGRGAGLAFDTVSGAAGSPGSDDGKPFALGRVDDLFSGRDFLVSYTDALLVDGKMYGDLFTVMTVNWGLDISNQEFLFVSDTDKITRGSTISPFVPGTPNPVPEPATLALVGLGLLAAAAARRRRA